MNRAALAAFVLVTTSAVIAAPAEDEAAQRAFEAAMQRALTSDPEALPMLETLGAARPVTAWTDDAWLEAARLAERAGDLARARRDLEQVLATTTDPVVARRARGMQERIANDTAHGTWDAVAVEHERLVNDVQDGDDPRAPLQALEALVRVNPGYPRATAIRLAIARGWEEEGDRERALAWLREAVASRPREPGRAAQLALARMLIRDGALDEAAEVVASLSRDPAVDLAAVSELERRLETVVTRAWLRRGAWALLGLVAAVLVSSLRRTTGSWRRAARAARRIPAEALFLVPVAVVLIAVAAGGNPLVARAVRDIAIGGVVIAWLSGVVLDASRARAGRLAIRHALVHAAVVMVAVGALAYLAIDRDRLLDLVGETWRAGPNLR